MTENLLKHEPFQLLQNPEDNSWLNTMQMAAIAPTIESRIRQEILDFCERRRELPKEIKANPLTIIEMPFDQWTTFHINIANHLIEVPVMADCTIPIGEIQCVVEQATTTMVALRAQERNKTHVQI